MLDRREVFEIENFDLKMIHRFDKNLRNQIFRKEVHLKDLPNE